MFMQLVLLVLLILPALRAPQAQGGGGLPPHPHRPLKRAALNFVNFLPQCLPLLGR